MEVAVDVCGTSERVLSLGCVTFEVAVNETYCVLFGATCNAQRIKSNQAIIDRVAVVFLRHQHILVHLVSYPDLPDCSDHGHFGEGPCTVHIVIAQSIRTGNRPIQRAKGAIGHGNLYNIALRDLTVVWHTILVANA